MSTVFKLLGSNASIDQEVNRIDDLESEFMDVSFYLFGRITYSAGRLIPLNPIY